MTDSSSDSSAHSWWYFCLWQSPQSAFKKNNENHGRCFVFNKKNTNIVEYFAECREFRSIMFSKIKYLKKNIIHDIDRKSVV